MGRGDPGLTPGGGTIFEASYESREQIKKNYPEAAKIAEEALIEYAKTIQE